MTEVSSTRLYLGNLPKHATKADIMAHFATHGTGEITDIKVMNGFGFIEYKDAMDARDVVPAFHGSDFMGERLTVQFARGTRHREPGYGDRNNAPRPRRTPHRMQVTGLPNDTSWQDLKDFARQSGRDVVYSETSRNGGTEGFVEFETAEDLRIAVEKLDGREFKNARVSCVANAQPDYPRPDRARSRSPRRGYPPPMHDDYDRRGPPRGYSPRRDGYRDGYRERSPPPRRDYYDDRRGGYRSPPRRGPPPMDDYPPPRGRYDDPYRGGPRDYPPPDPYMNGRGYDRPPPPRDFPPPRDPYARDPYPPRDYEPRRY
ncbi:hypothetical protein VTJ49DRAFT_3720 [Mycothermus thermophilus]|uniref:RRM domain-containing protein n=1 Tax=Humicola insolens TaxID=85995 RepID=A0ABR3VMJ4_HUMIN